MSQSSFVSEQVAGPVYLGVDGGGTYVRAVLVDSSGNEVGRGTAGNANIASAGLDLALENIRAAVNVAAHRANARLPFAAARLGLAGVDRPADYDLMYPLLSTLAEAVHLGNDAELGLYSLPGGYGVCLVSGTGSIALGRDRNGKRARSGGWGHLIGDEGSGYDIGRRALQAMIRASDGRGPDTTLVGAIMHTWGLHDAQQIIPRVYPDSRPAMLAQVAQLVFEQAEAGDKVARNLVSYAAAELATAVLAVANQLSFEGSLPLAFAGGVLRGQARLRNGVLRRISHVRPVGPTALVDDAALAAARSLIPS